MKTYKERTESILQKTNIKQTQRTKRILTTVSTLCLAFVVTVGAFHVPQLFGGGLKDMAGGNMAGAPENYPQDDIEQSAASGSGSSDMESVEDERYARVIQALKKIDDEYFEVKDDNDAPSEGEVSGGAGEQYVETTDNQVSGVIESDLIKRTDTHIFYLSKQIKSGVAKLSAYSVAGADSALISTCNVSVFEQSQMAVFPSGVTEERFSYGAYGANEYEMYLSEDGQIATVIMSCYDRLTTTPYVALVSVNVSNPAAMRVVNRAYVSGWHKTSRMIDGELLLTLEYRAKTEIQYDEPLEYIPHYGEDFNHMNTLSPDAIDVPERLTSRVFTTVYKYDEKTLANKGSFAVLQAFDHGAYVSETSIYFTKSYLDYNSDLDYTWTRKTDVYQIDYTGNGLELRGKTAVEGYVNDRFSMDEKEGVLRVVTSVQRRWKGSIRSMMTASLYCIRLSDGAVIGQVNDFAPEGESVRSARFEGDALYVCTATATDDPVFAFDLSDYRNITWKDTGTIPGLSTSLIALGDGYLLGVGYKNGGLSGAKVEIYKQTETLVESVAVYEMNGHLPSDYHAFFIDREYDLFGLTIDGQYRLLRFDGEELLEIYVTEYSNKTPDYTRAVRIDGYLYLFGQQSSGTASASFTVIPLAL